MASLGIPVFLLLASCMFETVDPESQPPGFLSLDLNLKPATNALLKTSSADTVFRLDSLIIVLTSSGQATITKRYAITGRADSAALVIAAKVDSLAPLRTWMANIYSIDTTLSPVRRDTVHRDSVAFAIKPGDTTFVSKTVNPAYSILRSRFVSTVPESLPNPIKWIRLRVDGTMRDSIPVGRALHSIIFGNGSNGAIVGDSGTILTTTGAGANWALATSVTTANLYGVTSPGANALWAVGSGGVVVKTTTLTSWSTVTSGTSAKLNATYFSGNNNGWAVGDGGVIIKTTNGTSFATEISGTAQNLNGVYFSSANNGVAVGGGGVIRATADGGATWTGQTSPTTKNLNCIFMVTATNYYAVGDSGRILKYTSGTWAAQTSGTGRNLTGIYFTTANNGTAVGDSGTILTTTNAGTGWTLRSGGTTADFDAVSWTTNDASGLAVGQYSATSYTTTNTTFTYRPFGAKTFDLSLTYKYLTPNVSHILKMDAIDTTAGSLRGYQVSKTVLLSPGKDTTVTPSSSLIKCGWGGSNPACN